MNKAAKIGLGLLAVVWTVGFAVGYLISRDSQQQRISDCDVYIEPGCHGRYQGEE